MSQPVKLELTPVGDEAGNNLYLPVNPDVVLANPNNLMLPDESSDEWRSFLIQKSVDNRIDEAKRAEARAEAAELRTQELFYFIADPVKILDVKLAFNSAKKYFKSDPGVALAPKIRFLQNEMENGYLSEQIDLYSLDGYDEAKKTALEDKLKKNITRLMNLSLKDLRSLALKRKNADRPQPDVDEPFPSYDVPPPDTDESLPSYDVPYPGTYDVPYPVTDEPETAPVEPLTSETLKDLNQQLDSARREYAKMLALRHERHGVIFSKRYSKAKISELEKKYFGLREKAGVEAAILIQGARGENVNEEQMLKQMLEFIVATAADEGLKLADLTLAYETQTRDTAKFKKFYSWIARQGIVGKTLIIAGVSIPLGLAAGLTAGAILAPAFVGPVVGGVLGGFATRGLARGLIASKIQSGVAGQTGTGSLGNNQEFAKQYGLYQKAKANPAEHSRVFTSQKIAESINASNEQDVNRDRRRAAGAIAVGAALGALAGLIDLSGVFHSVHGAITNHGVGNNHHTSTTSPGHGHHGKPGGHHGKPSRENHPKPQHESHPKTHGLNPNEINPANYSFTGNEYPWNYFAHLYGNENATDKILYLVKKAQSAGWKVNGLPNNNGISTMVAPNGRVFSGTPGIVAALQYFNH